MDDRIKLSVKETDVGILKDIFQDMGHNLEDVVDLRIEPVEEVAKPGEKVEVSAEGLRYVAQVAKETADSIAEYSPEKMAEKYADVSDDEWKEASRIFKGMFDELAQRIPGRFASVNYDLINQIMSQNSGNKSDELSEMFGEKKTEEVSSREVRR